MKVSALIPIFLLAVSGLACPHGEDHAAELELAERDIEIGARSVDVEVENLVARDEDDDGADNFADLDGTFEGEFDFEDIEDETHLMARATCNNGAGSGVCQSTSKACSGGKHYPGFCAGSASNQCCVKGTKLPTIPIRKCQKFVYTSGYKILKKYPTLVSNVGCYGLRSGKSDHPAGKALDFMMKKKAPNSNGNTMATWIAANYKSLRVTYVIWDSKIWNIAVDKKPKTWSKWRKYKGINNGCTARHCDHIHVSFK